MITNIPVCIDTEDIVETAAKNVQQEISTKIKKSVDKAICMKVGVGRFVNGKYVIDPFDERSLVEQAYEKLANEAINLLLSDFVRQYMNDNTEEIVEKITVKCADRILKSTKKKRDIVYKLHQLLTADDKQITEDGLVEEIKED